MVTAKPDIKPWVPPPTTKEDLDWASLKTLDLSKIDSDDPKEVDQLLEDTAYAIKEDGFLYLTNYGISIEEIHRQFAIAQYLLEPGRITDEEKTRLAIQQHTGSYAGYKAPKGWGKGGGSYDGIENFTFYAEQLLDPNMAPAAVQPFMEEIKKFYGYAHDVVNKRLLKLLSRVLELPDDYLWDNVQSKGNVIGEGYFRMVQYLPMPEGDVSNRIHGHTDLGSTTLLFSVPVSALQVHTRSANRWQWVKYKPGALVINLGESLEILTGGQFKATTHRVVAPPKDQRHLPRLSCAMFCSPIGTLKMDPLKDSPLIQREGLIREGVFEQFQRLRDAGMDVPDHDLWRRTRRAKAQQPPQVFKEINGVKHYEETFGTFKVLTPV